MYKLFLITFFLIFSASSFSQTDTFETPGIYKVTAIDSTENNYIIFVSSNTWDTISTINVPTLLQEKECNYYSIYHNDNSNQYCIISPKINDLDRNIYIGKNYYLSLNLITDKILNEVNFHIGYGDYILLHPTDNLYKAKEIIGLLYEQDIDSINYFSSIVYEKELFDSIMLYIWMNLNTQSNICYSQWLNEQIKQIKPIVLSPNEDIILYRDENCEITYITIRQEDYHRIETLETNLIFKYKNNCLIQIHGIKDIIYGWIKKKNCK